MRTNHLRSVRCLVSLALVAQLVSPALAAEAPEVARVKALTEAGQYAEAYRLGQSVQLTHEGTITFDFYYGLAALESGHYQDAAFALERATIRQPDQQRIRLELARAYFLVGNYELSRLEFNQVLAKNPPPMVQDNIRAFLARMDEAEQPQRGQGGEGKAWQLYVETSSGYDDNINSATASGAVATPFGTFDLSDDGQAQDDGFFTLGAGAAYSYSFSKVSGLDASLGLTHRNNFDSNTFDLSTLRLDTGYGETYDSDRWRVGLRGQTVVLDDDVFQSAVGIVGMYAHGFGEDWFASLTGAATTIRYDGDSLRDTDQYLLAGTLSKQLGSVGHSLTLYGADEPARNDDGKYNGRFFYGASYGLQWQASSEVVPYVIVGAQKANHDEDHPVFAVQRIDDQYSGRVGLTWLPMPSLSVKAEYRYTDVTSNISVFEYDRSEFEAGLRYSLQ